MRASCFALVLLAGAALPSIACAAPGDAARIRQLEDTVARQAALIEALELRLRGLEARLETARVPAPLVVASPPPVAATPPPAKTPDSPPAAATSVKPRGRVHADAWAGEGAGGTELRRARLGAEGKIDGRMPYVVEADFAGNAVSLQDVYLDYPLTSRLAVRLGYHKIPFGLDDQTSDNYNLFLEHPVGIDPFAPGRGVAAAVLASGPDWYAHAGVFGEGENDARDGAADEGVTVAGRLVWAPIVATGRFAHLAVAGYHTEFGANPALQLRERPGRHLAPFAIGTGLLAAEQMDAVGLEAAFGWGPFGAAGEYAAARVRMPTRRRLDYAGYSLEGWWTLTGEARPYKPSGGVFDRLAPARPVSTGGPGAWQLAARYSALDLNDPAAPAGELSTTAIAVNWYWTAHARLMLELNRAAIDTPASRRGEDSLGARVQYDW